MAGINKVAHLVLAVSDVDRSKTFYRDVLGLEPEVASVEYGWVHFITANVPLALYQPGKGNG